VTQPKFSSTGLGTPPLYPAALVFFSYGKSSTGLCFLTCFLVAPPSSSRTLMADRLHSLQRLSGLFFSPPPQAAVSDISPGLVRDRAGPILPLLALLHSTFGGDLGNSRFLSGCGPFSPLQPVLFRSSFLRFPFFCVRLKRPPGFPFCFGKSSDVLAKAFSDTSTVALFLLSSFFPGPRFPPPRSFFPGQEFRETVPMGLSSIRTSIFSFNKSLGLSGLAGLNFDPLSSCPSFLFLDVL